MFSVQAGGTYPVRIADGFLSGQEKRLLLWLARRLPPGVSPDMLTALGAAGAALTAISLAASHRYPALLWLAIAGLFVNWLGDSLDGTVARYRKIERPRYGFFVDHMTDVAAQTLIVLGLGLSPLMRLDVACVGLLAYLIFSIYTLVRLHLFGEMRISFFGIGPTEVRIALGAGLLLVLANGTVIVPTAFGAFSVFGLAVLALAGFSMMALVGLAMRDRTQLAVADPTPSDFQTAHSGHGQQHGSGYTPSWPPLVPASSTDDSPGSLAVT